MERNQKAFHIMNFMRDSSSSDQIVKEEEWSNQIGVQNENEPNNAKNFSINGNSFHDKLYQRVNQIKIQDQMKMQMINYSSQEQKDIRQVKLEQERGKLVKIKHLEFSQEKKIKKYQKSNCSEAISIKKTKNQQLNSEGNEEGSSYEKNGSKRNNFKRKIIIKEKVMKKRNLRLKKQKKSLENLNNLNSCELKKLSNIIFSKVKEQGNINIETIYKLYKGSSNISKKKFLKFRRRVYDVINVMAGAQLLIRQQKILKINNKTQQYQNKINVLEHTEVKQEIDEQKQLKDNLQKQVYKKESEVIQKKKNIEELERKLNENINKKMRIYYPLIMFSCQKVQFFQKQDGNFQMIYDSKEGGSIKRLQKSINFIKQQDI